MLPQHPLASAMHSPGPLASAMHSPGPQVQPSASAIHSPGPQVQPSASAIHSPGPPPLQAVAAPSSPVGLPSWWSPAPSQRTHSSCRCSTAASWTSTCCAPHHLQWPLCPFFLSVSLSFSLSRSMRRTLEPSGRRGLEACSKGCEGRPSRSRLGSSQARGDGCNQDHATAMAAGTKEAGPVYPSPQNPPRMREGTLKPPQASLGGP